MSIRVLHVIESLAAGGIETTFVNMLAAFRTLLPEDRHDVLAFDGGALHPRFEAAAHDLTIGCDTGTIAGCLDKSYDVVHILFERCAYRVLPLLLSQYRTPVVYGKGYDMGGMYRVNEGLDWTADVSMLAACDAATFTTPNLASGFPVPSGRSTLLRKAADITTFAALSDPDAHTPPRIVCVANLHPRKRLADLIIALPPIRCSAPDAELRLVGGGSPAERARLERIAAHAGVADAVSFAGQTGDVAAEISRSRLVALPSSCEGVPTALLEAMAAGRPVVSTRVGHVDSIVEDGVEGYLVDVGDITSLAARITRLLLRPEIAGRMGAAARRRARHHDVNRIAGELLTTLHRTASSGLTQAARDSRDGQHSPGEPDLREHRSRGATQSHAA
jgi:glycosyltransferase involved in cell wall biosynthesis